MVFPSYLLGRAGRAKHAGLLIGLLGLLGAVSTAEASGPTERLQQVFTHPTDPNLITVRFGMATSGYLYSKDGGKTFRALCSTAVTPGKEGNDRVRKISLRSIGSTAANAMDSEGRIAFSQYGSLYADDGTRCAWERVADFDDRWAFGIQADPTAPGVLWAAVSSATQEPPLVTTLEIARRDAEGAWTTVGRIVPPLTDRALLDGNMLVATHEGKTRLYVTADIGDTNGVYVQHVYVSDDEGKTWQDSALPAALDSMALLAVDPQDADRLVGVIWRDGQPDELYLSEDRGKTFVPYPAPGGRLDVRAVSGATFDGRGRFLVGDQGDGVGDDVNGGLFVAERLGAPLVRAEGTSYVDCVHYRELTDTLYVCSYDKLSTVDPNTFEAREIVRIESVAGLLECPGRDLVQECKDQLNEGSAWCCTGHFPFTPFCGAYDITVLPNGRRVFCGLAGREYERPGSTQGNQGDAGTPLASVDGAPEAPPAVKPKSSSGGGCALGEASGAGLASGLISALTVALAAMSRRRPRRRGN